MVLEVEVCTKIIKIVVFIILVPVPVMIVDSSSKMYYKSKDNVMIIVP